MSDHRILVEIINRKNVKYTLSCTLPRKLDIYHKSEDALAPAKVKK